MLQYALLASLNLWPHACLFFYDKYMTSSSNFTNFVRIIKMQKKIISHPIQGSSCWNECKLWSRSKVFVSNHSLTEQMRAGAASLHQSRIICLSIRLPPLLPPNRPSKASRSCINPPNHIKRWLISMTTNYFHNQMIPCRRYLSLFSACPFVRASKHSLQIGLI